MSSACFSVLEKIDSDNNSEIVLAVYFPCEAF